MNLWRALMAIHASVGRDYHGVVNVNQLIIDFVVICDKLAKVLDLY